MIKNAIKKLEDKADLTADEMKAVFSEIMDGLVDKEDIKKFLITLNAKGEKVDEIVAAALVMREKAARVDTGIKELVDTCGTGGAKINDVNISTIVAFIMAGLGVKIAKHGNRSFTGKCGSADLLEALGVKIEKTPNEVADIIKSIGIGFMFAPLFHPAMKNVKDARKELATKTIFNILGPLSNPAGAAMQLIGVYKPDLTEVMAQALKALGSERACVVHGLEGIDEISIKGKTKISELAGKDIKTYCLTPESFGLKQGRLNDIKGGPPEYNAKIALDILSGKKEESLNTIRNMAMMNAACGLCMVGKAKDLKEAMAMAGESIDSKKALEKLNALKEMSSK